jgi:hypothetical protein
MTTAVVGAATTFLGYQQVENLLVSCNQALGGPSSVESWWLSLTSRERESASTKDELVRRTERILQEEQGGWAEEMTEAMDEFVKDDSKEEHGKAGCSSGTTEGAASNTEAAPA